MLFQQLRAFETRPEAVTHAITVAEEFRQSVVILKHEPTGRYFTARPGAARRVAGEQYRVVAVVSPR